MEQNWKTAAEIDKTCPGICVALKPKNASHGKVYLRLNYDASGHPYLIADNMENKENRKKK